MFDITRQIKCKTVAIRYIDSCESLVHTKTMKRYIDLYHIKHDDFLGKCELKNRLEDKIDQIKTNKNK
jgi:hypothetical protein